MGCCYKKNITLELALGLSNGWRSKGCDDIVEAGSTVNVLLASAEKGTCAIYGGEFDEIVT